MIKKPICFLSAHPNCIDLVLTNEKEFFKNTNDLGVGVSFQMEKFKTELDQNLKSNTNFNIFQL